MNDNKKCITCNEDKPITSFQKDNSNKSGYKGYCKLCRKESLKRWEDSNPEYYREYRLKNLDVIKEKQKNWETNNKGIRRSLTADRRARKSCATPDWLSDEDKENIRFIYAYCSYLSSITKEEFHVDHIIPLKGKYVCGLHVPWNLQVLHKSENLAKKNKVSNS